VLKRTDAKIKKMNPQSSQRPETVVEVPPRYAYLSDLKDGVNYQVIEGKHSGSKLVIFKDFGYSVNKKKLAKGEASPMYYLRCKYFPTCKATAFIRKNYCARNDDLNPHTCPGDGASKARWYAQAALTRMRNRAMKETSTFDVSN